ncbi:MAG: hypothetical protein JNJ88_13800 [Planctomycetes bacterium]|nr:hypothetical protein [Planctomycetota bacterium]
MPWLQNDAMASRGFRRSFALAFLAGVILGIGVMGAALLPSLSRSGSYSEGNAGPAPVPPAVREAAGPAEVRSESPRDRGGVLELRRAADLPTALALRPSGATDAERRAKGWVRGKVMFTDGRPVPGALICLTAFVDTVRVDEPKGGSAPGRAFGAEAALENSRRFEEATRRAIANDQGEYELEVEVGREYRASAFCEGLAFSASEESSTCFAGSTLHFFAKQLGRLSLEAKAPERSDPVWISVEAEPEGVVGHREYWDLGPKSPPRWLRPGTWKLRGAVVPPPGKQLLGGVFLRAPEITISLQPGENPPVPWKLEKASGVFGTVTVPGRAGALLRPSLHLARGTYTSDSKIDLVRASMESVGLRQVSATQYEFEEALENGPYALLLTTTHGKRILDRASFWGGEQTTRVDLVLREDSESASLRVRVIGSDGKPVEDARFSISGTTSRSSFGQNPNWERLADGDYVITFSSPWQESRSQDATPSEVEVHLGVSAWVYPLHTVTLSENQRELELRLPAPAALEIQVMPSQGCPLDALEVELLSSSDAAASPRGAVRRESVDRSGRAGTMVVSPGEYSLQILDRGPRGFGRHESSIVIFTQPVVATAGRQRLELRLPTTFPFRVEVPEASEEKVKLHAFGITLDTCESLLVQGAAVFERIPRGQYRVTCGNRSATVRIPEESHVVLKK